MLTPRQIALLKGKHDKWLTALQLQDKGLVKVRASRTDDKGLKHADFELTEEGRRVLLEMEDQN